MKKGKTELVFILDRSGSMSGLERDTIGGFNSVIEKHNSTEGECIVTTVLFDTHYELLHDRMNILQIKPITENEYFVRGSTALLDAVGKTINSIGLALHNTTEEDRPSHVLFVIITDGEENASKEFTRDQIKQMVEHQTDVYKWEFIFMGANIDAFAVAGGMGIARHKTANYMADSQGTRVSYSIVDNIKKKMAAGEFDDDVMAEELMKVEDDHKKRSKKG